MRDEDLLQPWEVWMDGETRLPDEKRPKGVMS